MMAGATGPAEWRYCATGHGGEPDETLSVHRSAVDAWEAWADELDELRARPGQSKAYLARCVVGPDGRPMDEDPRAQAVAVGVAEIAALLRVEAQTARNWRTRGVLPEPDWTVSGGPAWSWPRVAAWAMRTGRL